MENKKVIDKDFVIEKIEHCKAERNKLMLVRNVLIFVLASAVFLANLGGHLVNNGFSRMIIILSYFYGGLAITCITLQIIYRIAKYKQYVNILEKYEFKVELSDEEIAELKREMTDVFEFKMCLIMIVNFILNSVPIVIFLGLLYYIINIFN